VVGLLIPSSLKTSSKHSVIPVVYFYDVSRMSPLLLYEYGVKKIPAGGMKPG
jgi:hypothetical protein